MFINYLGAALSQSFFSKYPTLDDDYTFPRHPYIWEILLMFVLCQCLQLTACHFSLFFVVLFVIYELFVVVFRKLFIENIIGLFIAFCCYLAKCLRLTFLYAAAKINQCLPDACKIKAIWLFCKIFFLFVKVLSKAKAEN